MRKSLLKKISFSILAFSLLFTLTACDSPFVKKEKVELINAEKNTEALLIASGHPEWPPIMYQDGEKISGAGADLAAMIFKELGINVDSRYAGTWDKVQEKTKSGEVDLLVAAYKTPERETYMDYSIPYTIDPVAILVKKGKAFPYSEWKFLLGKKGVVMVGDSYGEGLDNYIEKNLQVVKVNSTDEAYALLQNGKADYFLYAFYSAEKELKNKGLGDKIEILPNYAGAENFYITLSKKSPFNKYLPDVNRLIEKFKKDGTIESLIKKYKDAL